MRGRVLCRLGKEAARLRRQRRKNAKKEVREVIRSFISAADDVEHTRNEVAAVHAAGGDSDEEFWRNLPTVTDRSCRIRDVPVQASRLFPGRMVRSRMSKLQSAQVSVSAVRTEDVV